jgi:hypothetical protein
MADPRDTARQWLAERIWQDGFTQWLAEVIRTLRLIWSACRKLARSVRRWLDG